MTRRKIEKKMLAFFGRDEGLGRIWRWRRLPIDLLAGKLNKHSRLLAMAIHRAMAAAFKKPCLHMILESRPRFPTHSQERVLDAISGAIPIPAKEFGGIRHQRALVPSE